MRLRLKPVEGSGSLLGSFLSWATRKSFGKDLLSTQVSYARLPSLWWGLLAFMRIEGSMTLPKGLGLLIHTRASMQNHCTFCQDISRAYAIKQKLGLERFNALPDWRSSNQFSEAERAALAYIEAVNDWDQAAMDQAFQALHEHFSERQIIEITAQNAIANFHNLMNVPMGLEADGLEELAKAA